VPDITAIEIPKPKNWQDFQRGCVPLFRNLIRDEHLQEWGRDGQNQKGIDLHGYRDGNRTQPVGVQCRRIKNALTEKALRTDVEAAREIKPALTEIIFATVSDTNVKIQEAAARLTEELHESGWSCRVIVMGWQNLTAEIVRFPDALEMFLPSGRTPQQPIIAAVQREGAKSRERADRALDMLSEVRDLLVSRSPPVVREEDHDPELEPEAKQEPAALHTKISTIRDFIRKGRTRTALEELEQLLARNGSLPAYARYRVLANIAAVHSATNRYAEALDFARQAAALRPDDPKAQTNLAYAELQVGDRDAAARRASGILANHPTHGQAASALLQARAPDRSVSDPYAIVPSEVHDTPEFKIAAIVFLRQHDDSAWRELAARAAEAHPDNDVLRCFAAEAVLEPILNDAELRLGKPAPEGSIEKCRRATETLRELWQKGMSPEEVNASQIIPLAANLASALRFTGDDTAGAEVLDSTITRAGRDAELIRARALLYLQTNEDQKAVALIEQASDEPDLELFAAHIIAGRDPEAALQRLEKIDTGGLSAGLQHVVPEVRAEIALAQGKPELLRVSLDELQRNGAPVVMRAMIEARGRELKLLPSESDGTQGKLAELEDEGELDELFDDERLPDYVTSLIRTVQSRERELTFAERVQVAQYLDQHGAFEVASDLLHGHVDGSRDSVALRTYLSASVGANLGARAQNVLDGLSPEAVDKPFYRRVAAAHYWNTGDVGEAAPRIEALLRLAPERLDYFLWHVDALKRTSREDEIRELLQARVEERLSGAVAQRMRLAAALATFEQPARALKLAYRTFALNRNTQAAWMGFMSIMLNARSIDGLNLLTEVIGPDYAFELVLPDLSARRYIIETDDEVRKVEADALPLDHAVSAAVEGLKPGDSVAWPVGGGQAKVTAIKHKYLDAFHACLERYAERFPAANGIKRVMVTTEGEQPFAELKAELRARSEYVQEQTRQYADGKLSLAMLAHMTGADPIDTMIGLREVGTPYRVAVGLEQERRNAFAAIAAAERKGCVIDIATFHCIRRLGIEEAVLAVCGRIGVTQATLDTYEQRLQSLHLFGGSIAYRDENYYLTKRRPEELERVRTLIDSDMRWLKANADVLPARPQQDPPAIFRRLGLMRNARFFDEVYAASGSGRLLLVDDLFMRQVGAMLGTHGTWLQPVLTVARDTGVMSPLQYSKAVSDLVGAGQDFISIDAAALAGAMSLDRQEASATGPQRLKTVARALGGKNADVGSHCSVVISFLRLVWSSMPMQLADYAASSEVLQAVLRARTEDYAAMLSTIDLHMRAHREFSGFLRQWARGHFLHWPPTT
jgi:Flp pilus assembly protein TadD